MKFATITMNRGNDRPQFLEFCHHQLSRMNTKPDKSYFICDEPKSDAIDLVPRVKLGIQMAKQDGFDLVFIVESDDYYGKDYFDNIPDADFIGSEKTTYYNLRNNTYQDFIHPKRSSLFTTGFKISALGGFNWPADDYPNLDIRLWAMRKKFRMRETGAIGVKHNCGKVGGRGHTMTMKYTDQDWEWLKSKVDTDAFLFYKSLNL